MDAKRLRLVTLTAMVLLAFAANSLLCRAALRPGLIDPATFSVIRVIAGAITLMIVMQVTGRKRLTAAGDWLSAATLVGYVIPFSLAYTQLDAGIGALILFGCVQATIILWSLRKDTGQRPLKWEWVGLALALSGLAVLTLKGQDSPDLFAAGLMAIAGMSWASYTLRGRGSGDPIAATAGNFLRGAPLALVCTIVLSLTGHTPLHVEDKGVWLAVASGSITSGLGYSLWYYVVPQLRTTITAMVQLSVPVIVVLLGVMLLKESLTPKIAVAAAMILGGIAVAVIKPKP